MNRVDAATQLMMQMVHSRVSPFRYRHVRPFAPNAVPDAIKRSCSRVGLHGISRLLYTGIEQWSNIRAIIQLEPLQLLLAVLY